VIDGENINNEGTIMETDDSIIIAVEQRENVEVVVEKRVQGDWQN